MALRARHLERHAVSRIGWMRAAVLGANDGIVSTASLIMGVIAANGSKSAGLLAGVAGLVAGAMSMAAGEYVSVSSQADAEKADLQREKKELETDAAFEREELAQIYVQRGVSPDLARQVADQMMAKDPLAAHARDELGITDFSTARPLQAAAASAATFTLGAALPLVALFLTPMAQASYATAGASLVFLAILGTVGARAGDAPVLRAIVRVVFWGAAAMAITMLAGSLVGSAV